MRPEVARDVLLATHGGLSLELSAVIYHISPMVLYRLVCALGPQSVVTVLTRCGLPLPSYILADEKHSRCLTNKVYLPTVVSGRVIWHPGYTEDASVAAFTQSYGGFQRAASQQEPSYRVQSVLTDGFDSTIKSIRTLYPGARLGNCLRHAITKLPKKLVAIASPVRQALRSQFHTLIVQGATAEGLAGVCARPKTATLCGPRGHHSGRRRPGPAMDPGQEGRLYAVLENPRMPVTSTLLDQAHNAIKQKLFAMIRVSSSLQPGPLSAPCHACQAVWCGSRRRATTHNRLIAQSANPHLRRLSMNVDTFHHVIRWNLIYPGRPLSVRCRYTTRHHPGCPRQNFRTK